MNSILSSLQTCVNIAAQLDKETGELIVVSAVAGALVTRLIILPAILPRQLQCLLQLPPQKWYWLAIAIGADIYVHRGFPSWPTRLDSDDARRVFLGGVCVADGVLSAAFPPHVHHSATEATDLYEKEAYERRRRFLDIAHGAWQASRRREITNDDTWFEGGIAVIAKTAHRVARLQRQIQASRCLMPSMEELHDAEAKANDVMAVTSDTQKMQAELLAGYANLRSTRLDGVAECMKQVAAKLCLAKLIDVGGGGFEAMNRRDQAKADAYCARKLRDRSRRTKSGDHNVVVKWNRDTIGTRHAYLRELAQQRKAQLRKDVLEAEMVASTAQQNKNTLAKKVAKVSKSTRERRYEREHELRMLEESAQALLMTAGRDKKYTRGMTADVNDAIYARERDLRVVEGKVKEADRAASKHMHRDISQPKKTSKPHVRARRGRSRTPARGTVRRTGAHSIAPASGALSALVACTRSPRSGHRGRDERRWKDEEANMRKRDQLTHKKRCNQLCSSGSGPRSPNSRCSKIQSKAESCFRDAHDKYDEQTGAHLSESDDALLAHKIQGSEDEQVGQKEASGTDEQPSLLAGDVAEEDHEQKFRYTYASVASGDTVTGTTDKPMAAKTFAPALTHRRCPTTVMSESTEGRTAMGTDSEARAPAPRVDGTNALQAARTEASDFRDCYENTRGSDAHPFGIKPSGPQPEKMPSEERADPARTEGIDAPGELTAASATTFAPRAPPGFQVVRGVSTNNAREYQGDASTVVETPSHRSASRQNEAKGDGQEAPRSGKDEMTPPVRAYLEGCELGQDMQGDKTADHEVDPGAAAGGDISWYESSRMAACSDVAAPILPRLPPGFESVSGPPGLSNVVTRAGTTVTDAASDVEFLPAANWGPSPVRAEGISGGWVCHSSDKRVSSHAGPRLYTNTEAKIGPTTGSVPGRAVSDGVVAVSEVDWREWVCVFSTDPNDESGTRTREADDSRMYNAPDDVAEPVEEVDGARKDTIYEDEGDTVAAGEPVCPRHEELQNNLSSCADKFMHHMARATGASDREAESEHEKREDRKERGAPATCAVCQVAVPNVIYFPCGHRFTCVNCESTLSLSQTMRCSVCDREIERTEAII